MEGVRNFLKPYLKRRVMVLAAAIVMGTLMILTFWFRQSKEISLLQNRHQDVLCTLWRNKITLQLASLRTKHETNRETHLFETYARLETTIKKDLPNCSDLLEGYRPRPFKQSLEALAVQLIQRDDTVLDIISDLETMFFR